MDIQLAGPITIDTPLGDDLTCLSMGGIEAISRPFVYELDVLSTRSDIEPAQLIGQSVTVHLALADEDDHVRHWNGRVTRLEYLATGDDGTSRYRLTLRPWLWELTRSADCRIFQRLSVPDIVTQVFQNRGFADFERALFASYPVREYVVQYRETDLHFVSRLLESAGIYYFFQHDDGKHTLVLADSPEAHDPTPGCERLPYAADDTNRDETTQYVRRWRAEATMETAAYALRDFDFTKPRVTLYGRSAATDDDAGSNLETYDYPGGFDSFAGADAVSRLRLAQARRDVRAWNAATNARGLTVGSTFSLVDHPRDDQNKKYLVTAARYRLRANDPRSGAAPEEPPFACTFSTIDASVAFRPALSVPKPLARGPQTATVVGAPGQEIWTDRYGRVKVQFHWDRLGGHDENSSCFVRVSQAWAGNGWGAQFVPRIGQEVIVDFLEGDPDRPIITGTVYNGANAPPFDLPGNQTQSGVRTRSTPGGSVADANEIRFEDRTGAEELYVQAQKDMNVLVKHDESLDVLNDRDARVGANETLSVGVTRTRRVGVNENVAIGVDQSVNVGAAQTVTVGAERIVTVGANDTTVVGADQRVTVGGDFSWLVAENTEWTTEGNHAATFGGNFIEQHVGHRVVVVGGAQAARSASLHVEGSARAYATTTIEAIALQGLTITCGKSSIQVTPDAVTITSPTISLVTQDAEVTTAKFSVAATGAVTVGGSSVTVTSSGATVTLDSNATVQGTQVKLGAGGGSSAQSPAPPPKVTTLTLVDQDGNPLANRTVILRTGGPNGAERTVVLDEKATMTVPDQEPFDIVFPEMPDATKQ
jgi:type VI secretion system secreted protein VgrG